MDRLTLIFGPDSEARSAEDAAKRSNRSFVRSEAELAIYEESRNPTGHVLTAWEAFTSFGLDTLEEAVEYGSAILRRSKNATGNALRRRREDLGLPHSSVGKATRISPVEVKTAESSPSRVPLAALEAVFLLPWAGRAAACVQGGFRRRFQVGLPPKDPCKGTDSAAWSHFARNGPTLRGGGVDHPRAAQATRVAGPSDRRFPVRAARGLWFGDESSLENRIHPCARG